MSETYAPCERCRMPINPDDPDTIKAVEQVDVSGFGEPEFADGMAALFHASCFDPDDVRYRRLP